MSKILETRVTSNRLRDLSYQNINPISSPNPVEPPFADLVSEKHSFLWSAPQDFPSEHLLDPKVLQDFAAFLQGYKGRDGLKGEAVAKYLKEYSKGPDTYDVS